MAFAHSTGVAANIVNLFARLESFLSLVGWTLTSGGGTTDIVWRSTGELGGWSKLYVRLNRDLGVTQNIYFRVQDDAIGTHATTTVNVNALVCPGVGNTPFTYWVSADKNCIILVVKSGADYWGCYCGAVEPFSLAVTNEEQRFGVIATGRPDATTYNMYSRMLRKSDGTWNFLCANWSIVYQAANKLIRNPLDNSALLVGSYVRGATNTDIYGQPFWMSGNLGNLMGLASEDTIHSGFPGVVSSWIVFVTNGIYWAMCTAGPLPLGVPDGTFTYASGNFANVAAAVAGLKAFLNGIGWVDVAWHAPIEAGDSYWTSTGESGLETIKMRTRWSAVGSPFVYVVDQNAVGFHSYNKSLVANFPADYPLPYRFIGDRDSFNILIRTGALGWQGMGGGKFNTTYPNEAAIPYENKEGVWLDGAGAANATILKNTAGGWGDNLTELADNYTNSSPQLGDGLSYMIWPLPFKTGANILLGTFRYVYRLSGAALLVNDLVNIGLEQYEYLPLSTGANFAVRIA